MHSQEEDLKLLAASVVGGRHIPLTAVSEALALP